MTAPPITPPLPAEAAMLLVLLPAVGAATAGRVATLAALDGLQRQLGAAIRILTVDGGTHPNVVQTFHATDLPCFVLMQQGVELLRQCGLPEGEAMATFLLRRVGPSGVE